MRTWLRSSRGALKTLQNSAWVWPAAHAFFLSPIRFHKHGNQALNFQQLNFSFTNSFRRHHCWLWLWGVLLSIFAVSIHKNEGISFGVRGSFLLLSWVIKQWAPSLLHDKWAAIPTFISEFHVNWWNGDTIQTLYNILVLSIQAHCQIRLNVSSIASNGNTIRVQKLFGLNQKRSHSLVNKQ